MLRKNDSNRILKCIKAVAFATSLSLLNPINVNAADVDGIQLEESDKLFGEDLLKFCMAAGVVNLVVSLKLLRDFNKYADGGMLPALPEYVPIEA